MKIILSCIPSSPLPKFPNLILFCGSPLSSSSLGFSWKCRIRGLRTTVLFSSVILYFNSLLWYHKPVLLQYHYRMSTLLEHPDYNTCLPIHLLSSSSNFRWRIMLKTHIPSFIALSHWRKCRNNKLRMLNRRYTKELISQHTWHLGAGGLESHPRERLLILLTVWWGRVKWDCFALVSEGAWCNCVEAIHWEDWNWPLPVSNVLWWVGKNENILQHCCAWSTAQSSSHTIPVWLAAQKHSCTKLAGTATLARELMKENWLWNNKPKHLCAIFLQLSNACFISILAIVIVVVKQVRLWTMQGMLEWPRLRQAYLFSLQIPPKAPRQ